MPHWMSNLDFTNWTASVSQSLAREKTANDGVLHPAIAYGRHRGPHRYDARRSAVLMLLAPGDDGPELVLTRRSPDLKSHSGQISLPGGKVDGDETPEQTALREYHEELRPGSSSPELRILGKLPDIYVFVSNFVMTPVVAAVPLWADFSPNPSEVAGVYRVSLAKMRDLRHWIDDHLIRRGQLEFHAPAFVLEDGSQVWGATCLAIQWLLQHT